MFNFLVFFCIFNASIKAIVTSAASNMADCGIGTINVPEGTEMTVNLYTDHHMHISRCANENTKLRVPLIIQRGKTHTFKLQGDDSFEGTWTCTFLQYLQMYVAGTIEEDGKYYIPTNCTALVKIQRKLKLTITNTDLKKSVKAETDDLTYYYYKTGENVEVNCKKEFENHSTLHSGSLMIKFCYNNGYCADYPTSAIYINNDFKLRENMTNSVLHCIYKNIYNEASEARVEFLWQPAAPKIYEEFEKTVASASNRTFDGKIGQFGKFICINSDRSGTIHWEFCQNEHGQHCTSTQASSNELTQNFTLNEDSKGNIARCVFKSRYTNSAPHTDIILYANESPILTIGGEKLIALEIPDTFAVQGHVDDYVGIRCSQPKNKPYVLYWKTCIIMNVDTPCTKTKSSANTFIDSLQELSLDHNNKIVACIFKNSRGKEFATKMIFQVSDRSTSTTSRLQVTTPSLQPATEPTNEQYKGGQEVVQLADRSDFPLATNDPELQITKNGVPVSKFEYNDILDFKCSDSSFKTKIIIGDGAKNYTVPITVTTSAIFISHGHYLMNFTSPSVFVTCYSLYSGFAPINRKVITLHQNIKEKTDDKGSGGAELKDFFNDPSNLMWIYIGAGIIIILIVLVAIVKVFKKGKKEEAMIQRASVNYEHFTNECSEPSPPFPKGPKLEQTYLAPVDLQESPYAVSRPQETDTYALPYTPSNVEELYSKPVPKGSRINALYSHVIPNSLRKNQKSSKYVNSGINEELNYAEIVHKKAEVSNKKYANITNKGKDVLEDNYATIANDANYANLNSGKNDKKKEDQYSNVFANDPYVNAKTEDYAEPSYCELNRKN